MNINKTPIYAHRSAKEVGSLNIKEHDVNEHLLRDLSRMGINFAMDSLQPLVTTASMATPIQFAQVWLPGTVNAMTEARKIDEIVGITTAGGWEYEEVVLGIQELDGKAIPYGDQTNIPLSSWNVNFYKRTIVRFEMGFQVGRLEEARAGLMNINSAESKRRSSSLALEVERNNIGFYGFNSGLNMTYGFLNDPGLPAYVTLPNGASGQPYWSTKTYAEINADIRGMVSRLRTQSGDNIDPDNTDMTLVVPTNAVDYLTQTTDFSISVRDWMKKAYPRIRVVSAPQLNQANGGIGVAYLFADKVNDQYSTDGGNTFLQPVPAQFMMLGVKQEAKGYTEDAANATAGVWCIRPWAVTRVTGVSP